MTSPSRRDFLKGIALGAAGAATAGLLQSPAAAGATRRTPDLRAPGSPDSNAQPSDTPRAGWCIYDQAFASQAHLSALKEQRPTIVRWFLSWDRYHLQSSGSRTDGIAPLPDWSGYATAFDLCRPSTQHPRGTLLVVQMQCKEPNWTGDAMPSVSPGTRWARGDGWFGRMYPDRFGVPDTYGAFVNRLSSTLSRAGVDHVFGAWNEVDLRTSITAPPWAGAVENFLDPWSVNPFNLVNGMPFFHWSGGCGEMYHDLYRSLPMAKWSTSGIYFPNWLKRTAAFGEVSHIDMHLYGTEPVADYVKRVEALALQWDAAAPNLPKRRFFIGEGARDSVRDTHDLAGAVWLYERHQALVRANANAASPLYGRYIGFAAHTGGGGTTSCWQLPGTDPAASWWQYKADYANYL